MNTHVETLSLPAIVKVESKMGTLGDLEKKYVMLVHIDFSVPTHVHYGECYDINGKKHEIATEHLHPDDRVTEFVAFGGGQSVSAEGKTHRVSKS